MEQNMQIIAKKFWNVVRVMYFMLRKGISKAKLFSDLNMMMKRGKIAGKSAIYNLMFHHHHAAAAARRFSAPADGEYEFSCSNSPAFHFPTFHKRKHHYHSPPSPAPLDPELLAAALEVFASAAASPALPGFIKPSPAVRQLRITDSPFPLADADVDSHVDKAAEEFITKFYSELKRQNAVAYLGYHK
ncbi:uncharacterized protein LOC127254682 [Andrographis paniculata]|uniref:uncharacterized protein LOC127254682 n=1 Tax=Andrographis paniculata TaxID=175694 RepID=UPI0021E8317C|nr:uncharacterized protein LOC127254682 [Andrographis paniculata]